MEELIKDFKCHLTLMADDLHDIVSHSNSIVQYIKEHESEWSRSGTGNNVQITPIGNEGRRIARYKIDDNPEGYIYAPTTTSGLNGDTTIIEPLNFEGDKVAIANFIAGNGSNTLYAPKPKSGNNGLSGQNGLDGLSTLFAFKGLSGDSVAETEWGLIKTSKNYPPNNTWSVSSNVLIQEGHMLYMTTAQRQGNNYITVNGAIWQKPVRIGSGSDTSHTGTDDDSYNYIYCRTIDGASPSLSGSTQTNKGVDLLNWIEAESTKTKGYKPSLGLNNPIDIPTAPVYAENGRCIDKAWTDHPYGVSSQLPFEWQVGFKKNEESGNWEYYFGPVIISHYGYDGLDGDGLEYIFYLLPKNLAGIPSLGAPYEGRIGENGPITLTKVSVNSTDYQLDDFIPTGWHDSPQTISEEYPRQYVSTRKKEGALEIGNLWQEFTPPRLWNIYATNGFLATLNNDSIIFDDDSDSDAIEYVSLTKAFLWDGANDVTLSNNYSKVTVTITCVGFSDKLRPGIASIKGNDVSVDSGTDWGTPMEINRSNYTGFALTKREGVEKLETKTGSITYTIKAYESGNDDTPKIEASRILTILVVDINDGTAYSLQVTPNTLGVSRTNETSPYTLRDAQSITVTATAASGKKVEKITIKNCNSNSDIQNIEDNNLYVEVKDSEGTLLGITPLEFSDTKSLVYTLGNTLAGRILSDGLDSIQYIVVDLYYKYLGQGIKIDSETVDFSVKGDRGLDGTGQGTESYVITTLNDNAVLDDLTIIQNDLKEATLNTYTVLKGNSYITLDCKFIPTTIELPSQLCLCTYNGGTYNEITTSNEDNLKNSFVLKYIGSNSESITPGNYYYDINIKYGETSIVTKRFKLYVDANISSDGSSYKLYITNDVIYYNYDGTIVLSTGNIIARAYKILNGTTDINIDEVVANISDISNPDPGKLYLVIGNYLESFASKYNGIVRINRELINYNIDGYGDISLYKGNLLVDGPERIDCIKYGSPGEDGYTVSSDNDNSKFGRYLNNDQLDRVTKQTFTIYKGSNDITSNCTYKVTESNLILSEFKILYSHGNSNVWHDILNLAFEGENQFRIQLNSNFNGNNFTSGEYYYDVTITYGSYSIAKRHKIIITKDYNTYVLKFVPDSIVYDENGSVLSEKNPYILVYNASGYEQPYTPVELLPNNPNSNINYVVLGPLNEAIDLQNTSLELNDGSQFKRYEINRNRVTYNNGGYFALLYRGSEFVDGPETLNCTKDKSATYNLEPYPTVLKFNVAPDGKTLTPSELIARCKISKKFEDGDPIFYNSSINDYCMFYNITTSDGQLVNISGAEVGSYVVYNNSDDDSAGIHISNNDLDYTRVNFYLAKRPSTMNVTPGRQSYTTSLTPIKQISVPILRDGLKGDSSSTGQTGRFYYFAGDWEGDVTSSGLKVTNYSYPYVYYLGSYYMYVGNPSSTDPYIISKADLLGTNINDITRSDNWKEMTYNKFVVSEAMFANYAKLGAAIFNRDWMISQYGSIGGTPSTDYTSFDPVKFMNAIKGYAEIGVIFNGGQAPLGESGSSYNILSQLFKLPLNNYTITVTLSGSNNIGKEVRLVKFDDVDLFKDVSKVSIITSGNSVNATIVADGRCDSNDSNPTILLNGGSGVLTSGNAVYCLLAKNSSNVNVSSIKVETGSYNAFIPNYALDLRSGFVYLNNAYIKGLVSTVNDLVVLKEESQNLSNWATVSDRGLFCRNDVDTPSPSLNEVLASIGVHKYTDNYGYTILSGEINLRRRLNRSSNWNYANLNGSGLTFAYHEGNSIPNLTEISALDIKTTLVIAPIIEGGYTFNGPKTPVAFPGNINLDAIVTLPKSSLVPYSGAIIFATNCKIVKVKDNSIVYNSEGQGETYSDTETELISSSALGGTHTFLFVSPRIFVGYYKDNILRWKEFCCRQ